MLFCSRDCMFLFFVFFLQLHDGHSAFSNSTLERNQDRYKKYEQCLKEHHERIKELDTQPLQAKIVKQGASIKLDCYRCLSPQQQEIIEDTWKPNGGFMGRKVQSKLYEFKQSARHHLNINVEKPNVRWEYMPLQPNAKWAPVLNLTEPTTFFRKFSKTLKDVISSSLYKIGPWFELEIRDANQSHAGWYRCIQLENSTKHISTLYFVEVSNSSNIQTREFKSDNASKNESQAQQLTKGVQVLEQKSSWTTCNKCGAESGQKFRHASCQLKLKLAPSEKLEDQRFEFLRIFDVLPCQSSLIPSDVRELIINHNDAYEFTTCTEPCLTESNETRVIERLSGTGEKEIIDELPPGEYSIHERLPLLKPRVGRHVVNKIEGESLILDCGIVNGHGVSWHYDFNDFNATSILAKHSQRIQLTSDGQLIFQQLKLEDRGLYSCFITPNQLVRTFRLYVAENDRTAELVSLIRMSIRFAAVFLLVVLVISVISDTDTRTERRRQVT